jgi:two-component system chemotaxis response regulator CheY
MKKVLVVDDSPTIRQQVGQALKQAGIEIVEASDGAEGFAVVNSNKDIGLVILDVNMPRMNGLEMLEKVKADPAHANLPIIMLTTEGQESLIQRAKNAGAKGWIVKPFNAPQLISAVKKIMLIYSCM